MERQDIAVFHHESGLVEGTALGSRRNHQRSGQGLGRPALPCPFECRRHQRDTIGDSSAKMLGLIVEAPHQHALILPEGLDYALYHLLEFGPLGGIVHILRSRVHHPRGIMHALY